MAHDHSCNRFFRILALTVAVCMLGVFVTTNRLHAQSFGDLDVPETPLILKSQGSFFVGGERVRQTRAELGGFLPDGHVTVNQMYVRYMTPLNGQGKYPVVMVHGMTLSGKSWETTPDGRMGWDEYFVRRGHATFVADQVGRGRSGFDQSAFNRVRASLATPESQPDLRRFTDENTWPNFRFGTQEGTPYPDTQYPFGAVAEASKQSVPDLNHSLPNPNPNYRALADLARQLDGVILMSHSQSGSYPLEAALIDAQGIRGLVLVEPGGVPGDYTDEQIAALAKLPVLIVFGDHIGDVPEGTGHSWQSAYDSAKVFIARVNAAGGNAQMLYTPEQGIRGNSHMIMQDRNNREIADLILKWIDQNVGGREKRNAGGSVMNTDTLSAKYRAIVPIASFTASGEIPRLRQSLEEGLEAGLSVNEIKQVLVQLYAYAGFPRSLNALAAFAEVLETRRQKGITDEIGTAAGPFPKGGKTALELGTEVQTALVGAPVSGGLMDFAPDIDEYLKAHLFGDVFGRDNLDWQSREIATVAALANLPGAESQLRAHYSLSMNVGITPSQLMALTDVLGDKVSRRVGADARVILDDFLQVRNGQVSDGVIFDRGNENVDYAQYFTGKSYLNMLTTAGVPVGVVTFEPGCRNNWHIHHKGGQILLVTGGRGWYQEDGKPAQELNAGDVVNIPAGVKHWHGAAKDSWFAHLALSVPAEGASNEWLEPVSDAAYDKLK